MAEAKINETCIIGLPTCGYAFSSSRMAFIAVPSDDEFRLEVNVFEGLLRDKDYEAYIALQQVDPAKLAFCTKICSKIITSQFCLSLPEYHPLEGGSKVLSLGLSLAPVFVARCDSYQLPLK